MAIVILGLFLLFAPKAALAEKLVSICDAAALEASRTSNVPIEVLRTVTRIETGRGGSGGLTPWPWTVNMEGAGHWFDDRASAQRFVARHFGRGARSFDVGCFQVNYRWHGQHFSSLEEMFDPAANAAYAAAFLSQLFAEYGDWTLAVGAYHSRTPQYASRYTRRFKKVLASLGELPADISPEMAKMPTPLTLAAGMGPLVGSGRAALGSLVPISTGASARTGTILYN